MARWLFLSTLSLRRATTHNFAALHDIFISIHALLAESDPPRVVREPATGRFLSTLSLRRATFCKISTRGREKVFLSTLSLRRATRPIARQSGLLHDFYPRSPCGERLHFDNYNLHCVEISIHALLAESDAVDISARREASISIHALLAESDGSWLARLAPCAHFYPRSPCGERPISSITAMAVLFISIHALLAESD